MLGNLNNQYVSDLREAVIRQPISVVINADDW